MTKRFLPALRLGLVGLFMAGSVARAADVELGKIPINSLLDVRIRSEYIENNGFNDDDYRFRARYRLRFGATAAFTEHVSAGFRLSSGDKFYATTAYQSLDTANFSRIRS